MAAYVCKSCRMSLRLGLRRQRINFLSQAHAYSSNTFFEEIEKLPTDLDPNIKMEDSSTLEEVHNDTQTAAPGSKSLPQTVRHAKRPYIDISSLLEKPIWSVRSLLPGPNIPPEDEITPEKLHHLLRLSALPYPENKDHEAKMLETLHSHLHFVRDIQKVNTDGVEPLRSIRDETEEGIKDITIGLEQLKQAFKAEHFVGKNTRPRRRRDIAVDTKGVEDWDVLGSASETVKKHGAKYFVVRRNGQMQSGKEANIAKELSEEDNPEESDVQESPVDRMYKKE